jgi:hypothetical protein
MFLTYQRDDCRSLSGNEKRYVVIFDRRKVDVLSAEECEQIRRWITRLPVRVGRRVAPDVMQSRRMTAFDPARPLTNDRFGRRQHPEKLRRDLFLRCSVRARLPTSDQLIAELP